MAVRQWPNKSWFVCLTQILHLVMVISLFGKLCPPTVCFFSCCHRLLRLMRDLKVWPLWRAWQPASGPYGPQSDFAAKLKMMPQILPQIYIRNVGSSYDTLFFWYKTYLPKNPLNVPFCNSNVLQSCADWAVIYGVWFDLGITGVGNMKIAFWLHWTSDCRALREKGTILAYKWDG